MTAPGGVRIDLFSDLDNTLIYSRRRRIDAPKVLAELLDGREQAYMTQRTLGFLASVRDVVRLVPVTTRTARQYGRIHLLADTLAVRHALVCNGGMLLEDGEVDPQWLAETRRLAGPALSDLGRAMAWLERRVGEGSSHMAEGLMAYAVLRDPAAAEALACGMRMSFSGSRLAISVDGRKVYAMPAAMSKGRAVERYMRRFGSAPVTVCAGDGVLDLSMFALADVSIGTRPALGGPSAHTVVEEDGQILSDAVCHLVQGLLSDAQA